MKIDVQSVNFNANEDLIDFAQKKIEKLESFFDKILSAEVYLKVVNTSEKENKIVEVKVNIPGDSAIVKKKCKTFEEGIDICQSSLERTLLKYKDKKYSK